MICDFARGLGEDELETIGELERDLGVLIVAFGCRTLEPEREECLRKAMEQLGPLLQAPPADPDERQLDKIREAERRLGLSLVAVSA